MCHCGRPLHYTDKAIYYQVRALIAVLGEDIKVRAAGRIYLVPRHYIALHGLKEVDLPNLGFPELRPRNINFRTGERGRNS